MILRRRIRQGQLLSPSLPSHLQTLDPGVYFPLLTLLLFSLKEVFPSLQAGKLPGDGDDAIEDSRKSSQASVYHDSDMTAV